MDRLEKIQSNIDVFGFEGAMRGMRNPKNSWHLQDSYINTKNQFIIGPNDLSLALRLHIGGPVHRKYLRMIHVQFDLDFTRGLWSEFDTYHFNVKNSCSTMHKLLAPNSPITKNLFLYDPEDEDLMEAIVNKLEKIRKEYINTKDQAYKNSLLIRAKRILPEGFLQLRTVDTNYEELLSMYYWRHNHRMPEWIQFCEELHNLPYFDIFLYFSEHPDDVTKFLNLDNYYQDIERYRDIKYNEIEKLFKSED